MAEGLMYKHLIKFTNVNDQFKSDFSSESQKPKKGWKQRRVPQKSSIFVQNNMKGASEDLTKNVLPTLRIDSLSEVIMNDQLILAIGSKLRSNHKQPHSIANISSKMRDMAKLVETMKRLCTQIQGLKDCLQSKNVKLLLRAVQIISELDEETGTVGIPSMPGRIKGSINVALETIKNDIRCDPNLSFDLKKEFLFDYQTT
ncbi:unnamed protein product [Bemisia tabaci]|uniref:Uncharacterized protein n=1 Tax=Bemisia tabaci TaxID=7038 RepID=A0A9P0F8E1_BEMTA|nr:unnamed protein product [Bemisia tabaci]